MLFDETEKAQLIASVTRDRRTRRRQWEEIIAEMTYACSVRTIRYVMASLAYYKHLPRTRLVLTFPLVLFPLLPIILFLNLILTN